MSENQENKPTQEDREVELAEKWARSNPENLPPQFEGDPEKFLKSYKEMRATLTRTQQELAGLKKEPKEPDVKVAQQQQEAHPDVLAVPQKQVDQPTGSEWNEWGQEILQSGDLSADTRSKIKQKFQVPDDVIDGYMMGIRARQKETVDQAAKVVGSQENLSKVLDWAKNNLDDAERDSVNQSLQRAGWQNVLLGLKARMDLANPEPKARVNTVNGIPQGIKPFNSSKEMTMAIRDPRYKYDSDYQNLIQERIRISGAMKIDA